MFGSEQEADDGAEGETRQRIVGAVSGSVSMTNAKKKSGDDAKRLHQRRCRIAMGSAVARTVARVADDEGRDEVEAPQLAHDEEAADEHDGSRSRRLPPTHQVAG